MFFSGQLKGSPNRSVCAFVYTCVHQFLLFILSPCIALKSVWQPPPSLTAGLRTQIHQVMASYTGKLKSETPQRGKATV